MATKFKRLRVVDNDKWRDAVRFLMGFGTNPSLTQIEQRKLREQMRDGMSENDAVMTLHSMGWEKKARGVKLKSSATWHSFSTSGPGSNAGARLLWCNLMHRGIVRR
jgi:hypothetical protein